MIINIRGTSGSGKSFLVRHIMRLYPKQVPVYVSDRRQPISYTLSRSGRKLLVVGHYESVCGGCDTVHSMDAIFDLVRSSPCEDALLEGVILSDEVNRTTKLSQDGFPVVVVNLSVPVDECIRNVNARRQTKKPGATPVKEHNTRARVRRIDRAVERLGAAGVATCRLNWPVAFKFCLKALGLPRPRFPRIGGGSQ